VQVSVHEKKHQACSDSNGVEQCVMWKMEEREAGKERLVESVVRFVWGCFVVVVSNYVISE